jgi:dTDP-4-amino-4,6-dideoxygalactose transaminase
MIPIARPLIGEEEKRLVQEVLESGQLAQGSRVAEFERRFAELCGVAHAVACSNGTAALHLALLAHDIGPGDEVITTPFSFIATAPLVELARHHGLALIEDAAQAHAARYQGRPVGSFGTGCFSFYPTKNITSGEGGMVTTNDPALADRLRMLRQHGMNRQYYHEILGFNFRLTDLQAAVGLGQLNLLNRWTEARRRNGAYYTASLPKEVTPAVLDGCEHVYHQYTLRVPGDRDRFVELLAEREVQARVYYPLPIHQQPLYQNLGFRDHLPHAERASHQVLSIPVHPALTGAEVEQVAAAVNEVIARS